MKSMSRGCAEPAAVTSTMLSPQRMTTEPPACLAHLPVSIVISLPPTMAVSRTNPILRVLCEIGRRGALRSCGLNPLSNPRSKTPGARRNDQTYAIPVDLRRYLVVTAGFIAHGDRKAKRHHGAPDPA